MLKHFLVGCLLFIGMPLFGASYTTLQWLSPADGETVPRIALTFHLAPEAHTYAMDHTDVSMRPKLSWNLPQGMVLGTPVWPKSKRLFFEGLSYQGYDRSFTVYFPVLSSAISDETTLSLDLFWITCTSVCTPHKETLFLSLSKQVGKGSFFYGILLFSFLAGVLLNVMPCVFPVLSLKVLDLMYHAKQMRRPAWHLGAVFSLGVLLSLLVLMGILFGLRTLGVFLGWGFQLQNPIFVFVMMIVFLAMGLNLLGVFELGARLTGLGQLSEHQTGLRKAFLTGILAVLVATPCSAPFMGTAMGYALTTTISKSVLIFMSLGFGMAFPYFVLTCFPRLLLFLPKPGKWMLRVKQILSIPLFLTVLWLGWVFWLQVSPRFLPSTSESVSHSVSGWYPYTPALLQTLEAENRSIFIQFTAAWCLSCQVNDQLLFESGNVQRLLKERNIVPIVADWTRYDASVTALLSRFGRQSIPFYVWIQSDGTVVPFPEVMTEKTLLKRLSVDKF